MKNKTPRWRKPLLVAGCIALAGCAGLTAQQALTDAEQIAVAIAPAAEQAYADYTAAGGKVNASQDIPLALQASANTLGTLYAQQAAAGGTNAALAQVDTVVSGLATAYSAQPQSGKVGVTLVNAALSRLGVAKPSAAQATAAIVGAGIAAAQAAPSQPVTPAQTSLTPHRRAFLAAWRHALRSRLTCAPGLIPPRA